MPTPSRSTAAKTSRPTPALSRRRFLKRSASGVAAGVLTASSHSTTVGAPADQEARAPLFVSTWPFGKPANEAGLQALSSGRSPVDAIELGINQCEAAGVESVGLSGIPNAEGVVSLDACIMTGPGHRAGGVAAVEGFVHPISIARRVMETTKHVLLVGTGAEQFAASHGFKRGPKVTPSRRKEWLEWRKQQRQKLKGHDTIAMVLLAPDGNLYGGCSTSGMGYKLPGRVGDSPIIGSGLYVDNEIGAAGATGIGENVMRFCGSFMVVEYMRQGLHPQDACIETIRRIARMDPKGYDLAINFIAIDKRGRFGAAGTGQGFQYSVTSKESSRVLQSPGLTSKDTGPVGGNRL
jgi:N4-(beta-N-acetylglucosaminyl)-L-asparaginase